RRSRADHADALVLEVGQVARRVAARVGVVPAAGVEGVASEAVDAGDARELRAAQRAGRAHHELRRHAVAPVRADHPVPPLLVPGDLLHARLEARVLVEVEAPGDVAAVLGDL